MNTHARIALPMAALFAFALGCGPQLQDGETPSNLSGFFTLGHQHNTSDGDIFMALGMVVTPSFSVEGTLKDHFSYFPDIEPGSCAELATMQLGDESTSFMNAGNVSVSGPAGSVDLQPFLGMYIGQDADSKFSPDGEYTISGDGSGDLGEFEGTVMAPERLTLTSPDPSADITIDRASDLALEWTSSGTADDVFVSITQDDGSSERTWMCKVEDTGSASIPSAMLSELAEDTTGSSTEVVVYKYAWSAFDGPGILSPFGALFVSETRVDAIVQ